MSFLKNRIIQSLFLTTIIVLLYSCENLSTPIPEKPNQTKLKTENKWKVNPITNQKQYLVRVKQYDINGNLVFMEEYNSKGSLNSYSTYTYNNDNSSTENKTLYDDNGIEKISIVCDYIYDGSNNLTKKIEYDTLGNISLISEFSYDDKGNLIKKFERKPNGSDISVDFDYTYNNNGDLIERKILSNGNILNKDSLSYNTNANSFDIINIDHISGQISSKTTYIYNNIGEISTEIESAANGNIVNKYIYEYLYYKK